MRQLYPSRRQQPPPAVTQQQQQQAQAAPPPPAPALTITPPVDQSAPSTKVVKKASIEEIDNYGFKEQCEKEKSTRENDQNKSKICISEYLEVCDVLTNNVCSSKAARAATKVKSEKAEKARKSVHAACCSNETSSENSAMSKLYNKHYTDDPPKTEKRKDFFVFMEATCKALGDRTVNGNCAGLSDPPSFKELFGKDGLEKYKLAKEEEFRSREFRTAVFLESFMRINGKKFNNRFSSKSDTGEERRHAIYLAGPSASGKSVSQKAGLSLMLEDDERAPSADFVSIDGGNDRSVSQMRKLALNCALNLGCSGIEDLDAKSKVYEGKKELKTKSMIEEAVVASENENLHMLKPDTFTGDLSKTRPNKDPLGDGIKEIGKKFSLAIINIVPDGGHIQRFQTTVAVQGERRAFQKQEVDLNPGIIPPLNKKPKGESKKYDGGVNFIFGLIAGQVAESRVREVGGRVLQVRNDRTTYKKCEGESNSNKETCWVEVTDPDACKNADCVTTTARAFAEYTEYIKSQPGISFKLWVENADKIPPVQPAVSKSSLDPMIDEKGQQTLPSEKLGLLFAGEVAKTAINKAAQVSPHVLGQKIGKWLSTMFNKSKKTSKIVEKTDTPDMSEVVRATGIDENTLGEEGTDSEGEKIKVPGGTQ
ncbi:MAG: hypothetical protein HQK53_14955 [Oligoflexia bacterium]|nr:hypothetical protein [Oligoflexia bacterium]